MIIDIIDFDSLPIFLTNEQGYFVKLQGQTPLSHKGRPHYHTIFYRKDEDVGGKVPNTVSFDVWTGLKKKYYSYVL